MCLVSVHTNAETADGVDLALPAGVRLAELLPDIVDLTAARDGGADGWRLSRVGGAVLDTDRTLRELDVRDGDLLLLETADVTTPRLGRDDWVARVMASTPDPVTVNPAVAVLGPVFAVVGALACAVPGTGPVTVGLVVVLLCGAAVCAAAAGRSQSAAATPLSVLTVALAAATGMQVVPGEMAASHALLAATAAAVASLALLRFHIGDTTPLTALASTSALTAGAGLAAVSVPLPPASAAALLTVVSLAALSASPRVSLLLAGLGPAAVDPDPTADADDRCASGHRILAGLVLGGSATLTLASLAVAAATLHRTGPWVAGALLCGAAGLVLLLRGRTFASARARWAFTINGTCCLVFGFVIVASALPRHTHWLGAALVCAGVAAIMRTGRGEMSPVAVRALDITEYLAIAAVPPLACTVLGLYRLVRDLALT
ncbi:type VII secretion integral membrane protein EccD [Mycobacterium sp. 852013-51886_SCH5428379]|nr:type VII secretion integral membrane protein EccD [Mycobacterium sp. 852013-51886_SCH5428379]